MKNTYKKGTVKKASLIPILHKHKSLSKPLNVVFLILNKYNYFPAWFMKCSWSFTGSRFFVCVRIVTYKYAEKNSSASIYLQWYLYKRVGKLNAWNILGSSRVLIWFILCLQEGDRGRVINVLSVEFLCWNVVQSHTLMVLQG